MRKYLLEIWGYRELLVNLIVSELKLRYRGSFLGFLWTILNPLFFLAILAVVFSKIIKFQVDNYIIYLFAGLTAWLMIQQTVLIATASVVNNESLIKKVYIPKLVFPLSSCLARYIDHAILSGILVLFMVFFKMEFTWSLLILPFVFFLHFVFSLGLSMIAAALYIIIRDVQHVLAILFQAFFYLTPSLYPIDVLPPTYRMIFLMNPFYYFIQSFRYPVYNGALPPAKILLTAVLLTVFVFVVGLAIFYKKEKYFVFHIS
jgi:ABC-type polysaccharide/polyol phosphate export permease